MGCVVRVCKKVCPKVGLATTRSDGHLPALQIIQILVRA